MDLKKRTMNGIEELEDFIKKTKDGRELKRAVAVKMILQKKSYHDIKELKSVSHSFISKWNQRFLVEGIESLKLQYRGGKGYLQPQQKQEVIDWLNDQDYCCLDHLREHIKANYDIAFQFIQTYYSLFKEAQISWKKTQKKNPNRNDKLVVEKK